MFKRYMLEQQQGFCMEVGRFFLQAYKCTPVCVVLGGGGALVGH